MFYIINKVPLKIIRRDILMKIFFALFVQSVILIIYRLELMDLGRVVYYSDAEVYWKHTLSYLSGNIYYAYNDIYIWISYFIQKTSPFLWVGWNNIYNILIVNISIVICAVGVLNSLQESKLIDCKYTIRKNINVFLNFTLFNPLTIYSLMRNLKDATYLLMVVLVIYFFQLLQNKKSKSLWILYIIFLFFMAVLLYRIRPWAFVSSILALYFIIEKNNLSVKKRFLWIVLFSVFAIILTMFSSRFMRIYSSTAMWVPIVLSSALEQTFIEKLISIPRLMIGPGPIRSLFGSTYFVFYTIIGNYMSFIGSMMWWIQISFMASKVSSINFFFKNLSIFSKYILLNIVIYILVYAMAYSGSSELRFRGVLYVLISALFFSIIPARLDKKSLFKTSLLLIIITIGGLIFG